MKKRILPLALALVIAATLLPVSAAAVKTPEGNTQRITSMGKPIEVDVTRSNYYGTLVVPIASRAGAQQLEFNVVGVPGANTGDLHPLVSCRSITSISGNSWFSENITRCSLDSSGTLRSSGMNGFFETGENAVHNGKVYDSGILEWSAYYVPGVYEDEYPDLEALGDTYSYIQGYELALTQEDIDTFLTTGEVFGYTWPGLRELLTGDASAPAIPTVAPVANPATLDGKAISLNAYLFTEGNAGTNYVMLRDVAALLSGTKAQFEVSWSVEAGITLTSATAYTHTGNELQSKGDDPKVYTPGTAAITVNGSSVTLTAYAIEGNNYFKLRDLGRTLGFDVMWDQTAGVVIDTSTPYSYTD